MSVVLKKPLNREALAWAAGFYDGEGYMGLVPNRQRPDTASLRISVVQAELPALERFRDSVGGLGTIGKRPPPAKPHHKQQWMWYVSKHETAQAIIAMLWPFLHTTKRAQAKAALMAWRNKSHKSGPPQAERCARGHSLADAYVWQSPRGEIQRNCRACGAERARGYRKAKP